MKRNGYVRPIEGFIPIHMPKNTGAGFVIAALCAVCGFALIWHIWWLAILGRAGAYATFVAFAWRDAPELLIPAEEVARIDQAHESARIENLRKPTR